MKYAGLTVTVISFLLLTVSVVSGLRRRIDVLKMLASFFRSLSLVTDLNESEIIRAAEKMISQDESAVPDFVHDITDNYREGTDMKELWKQSVAVSETYRLLSVNAKKLLLSFSAVFGKRSIDYFREFCKVTENEFSSLYSAEKLKFEKTGGALISVCLLSGVLLIIIFI